MTFSALDALATICTAELAESEEKNANSARKRKALASQFHQTAFDTGLAFTAPAGQAPEVSCSAPFLQFGMSSTSQRISSRPAFVSEPGVPLLPLAPASAMKLATPLSHGPPITAAGQGDTWTLPAAKRRGVVSAGGVPMVLSLGHANHFGSAAATRSHDVMRPLMPFPLETPDLARKPLPERSPASGRQQPMRALSPTGAVWQHAAPLRVSPTGSGASDGPCSLTGGAGLSGTASAFRPAPERLGRSPPCSPSPSPSAAGTDSDAEQQQLLLEDPATCVSRIVQSPSKGGPGLLEKMKLAQVLLTHRDMLNPEQVQMVVTHLSTVLQSADAQQLARQAAAQQRPHHHHDLADACQLTSERRLSATAGCSGDPYGGRTTASGSLPLKVSDEAIAAAAAAGLTGATHGAASSSSSHTRGGEHDSHLPRATASSAPAAASPGRAYQLAQRLQSLPRGGGAVEDDDEVALGRLAGAGCGGVAGGLLHSNSMECSNNADDVARLSSLLPPRFGSSGASDVSSLLARPPRRSSSELHMPFSTLQQQQQPLPTPSVPSPAAALSPQLPLLRPAQPQSQLGGAVRPQPSSHIMMAPAAHSLHERSDLLLGALAQRASAASGRGLDANGNSSAAVLQRLQAQHGQLHGRQFQAAAQQPQQRQQYPQHPRQQHVPHLHDRSMALPVPQLQHALHWGAREAAPATPAAVALMSAAQLPHARRGGMGLGASDGGCADGFVFVSRHGCDRGAARGAMLGPPEGSGNIKAALRH
ncbi:hypothetical protein HYH02_013680 [Chlamydomonas schloesseri]|uniref:Uncharacterized protein n=1 Tax=Chlamydomonas schloesseri TaxID=2026947 RepID=A0A835SVM6_9CHLO|nr:hypothetical protein HYH02_013680 [Chlamydomonas schloesseri]|eukprot:KAG2430683.1 hypothetical protein HYH02_013680 [Chlamydomonas schloesseri]